MPRDVYDIRDWSLIMGRGGYKIGKLSVRNLLFQWSNGRYHNLIMIDQGLVTNYGEAGATQQEGGGCK